MQLLSLHTDTRIFHHTWWIAPSARNQNASSRSLKLFFTDTCALHQRTMTMIWAETVFLITCVLQLSFLGHAYKDKPFLAAKRRKTSRLSVVPLEMCLTKEVVPLDTPLTKAPGPRVRPSYGSLKKSETPLPMLRTRLAGLPRISREPTTQPETDKPHLCYISVINHWEQSMSRREARLYQSGLSWWVAAKNQGFTNYFGVLSISISSTLTSLISVFWRDLLCQLALQDKLGLKANIQMNKL